MPSPEGFRPELEVNQNGENQDLKFKLAHEIELVMPDVLKRAKKLGRKDKTGLNDQNWDRAFEESFEVAVQKLGLAETYDHETIQKSKQHLQMKFQMYATQIKEMLGPQD